ncbi:MAG: hypothetical protein AB7S41_13090 [Parvibaculaceae bacterium]
MSTQNKARLSFRRAVADIAAVQEREAAPRIRQHRLNQIRRISMGRGILLWLLGVPIPIIILLALFLR